MRIAVAVTVLTSHLCACSDDDKGKADTTSADATTGATETAVASETSATDSSPADGHEISDGACVSRQCGPDPVTHEDCGACPTPGLRACNDGRCEASCVAADCAAMGYSENTCVSSGECDGSPDGSVNTTAYACSTDGSTCDAVMSAVDCGLSNTDCSSCDLAGTDDGLCEGDVCKAPGETTCTPPDCVDRACGPDPLTFRECGVCSGATLACNDGKCEATCDDAECAAMGYTANTCISSGECDGAPDGFISTVTFACNAAHTECEGSASAVDCGSAVTDCARCDFTGTDDGFCSANVCEAASDTTCE